MKQCIHALAGVLSLALCASLVLAVDQPPIEKPPAPEATDYSSLIKQLDSDRFAERTAASEKLEKAGRGAFDALSKAATSDSREASTRAIDILKKHLKTGNDATKKAARVALEKVANSENKSAARRAKLALTLEQPQNAPGVPLNRLAPLQLQVQGIIGGNGRRVSIRVVNGVKQIDAQEKGRKVKITDDPANGIKMEVTEKNKQGKEETKKYEAKNMDELKKKHPDAHKIYEQYNKQQNAIQIRVGRGGLQRIQLPRVQLPRVINPPQRGRINPRQANKEIGDAQQQLDDVVKELKQADIKSEPLKEKIEKALERLKEVGDKLDAAKKNVGG